MFGYNMTYYEEHKDKLLSNQKKYNLKNREKIRLYQRQYYLNREYAHDYIFTIKRNKTLITFD